MNNQWSKSRSSNKSNTSNSPRTSTTVLHLEKSRSSLTESINTIHRPIDHATIGKVHTTINDPTRYKDESVYRVKVLLLSYTDYYFTGVGIFDIR